MSGETAEPQGLHHLRLTRRPADTSRLSGLRMPGKAAVCRERHADSVPETRVATTGCGGRRRTTVSYVRRLEHVGVVVEDLEAATEFFLEVGLEREDATSVQ